MRRGLLGRLAIVSGCLVAISGMASGFGDDDPPVLRWVGQTGNWSEPSNWDPPLILEPDEWAWQVSIDRSNPVQSVVFLDTTAWTRRIAIDAGDTLQLLSGNMLKLNTPTQDGRMTNSGQVIFPAGFPLTQIQLMGGRVTRLRGGGTMTLADSFGSRIVGELGTEHLINENTVIQGAGRLGENLISLDNRATINANQAYAALRINPNSGGAINTGLMQATNNGRLELTDGLFLNAGGTIAASGGGRVNLSAATISGGTLAATGGSQVRLQALPAALVGVTNTGAIEVGSTELTLAGSIVNNGTIDIVGDTSAGGDGTVGQVMLDAAGGPISLSGNGSLTFVHGSMVHSANASGAAFIHGANHTISGAVVMDFNVVTLSNNGTIEADQPDLISIDLHNAIPSFNNGTLRATGTGGLVLYSGLFTNNGLVEVQSGSRVVFAAGVNLSNASGGVFAGGTWRVISDGPTSTLTISTVDFLVNAADVTLSGPNSVFPKFNFIVINDGQISILNGRNYVTDNWFTNNQMLTVGADSNFVVTDDFTQSLTGRVRLELPVSGDASSNGFVTVNGNAALNGTLELFTADGSPPAPGRTYQLLNAGSISGQFASVVAGVPMIVSYENGTVTARVDVPCPGDFNGDGVVDSLDLAILFDHWGLCPAPPTECPWDLNGDGSVGIDDWLIMNNNWGPCP